MEEAKMCGCVTDPFATLPPGLQPKSQKTGSLRRAECPVCGKEYWTNRATRLCIDCEGDPARDQVSVESM